MRISISDPSIFNNGGDEFHEPVQVDGDSVRPATNQTSDLHTMQHMVNNAVGDMLEGMMTTNEVARSELFRRLNRDGRTTIDDDCGYLDTSEITIEALYELYKRDPLARRICSIWPEESWRKFPVISDTDEGEESKFQTAFEELCRSINEYSWADKETATNEFWNTAAIADELSQIGNYGAIVIGVDDGKPLSDPIDGFEDVEDTEYEESFSTNEQKRRRQQRKKLKNGVTDNEEKKPATKKINYLQPYSQRHCKVSHWESRADHPRKGMPVYYELRTDTDMQHDHATGVVETTTKVHWSRVVHVCPNSSESRVLSDSQLLVTYNRLWDAVKVYAGGGEGFWQGALPGISLEPSGTEKISMTDSEVEAAKTAMNDYINGVKRFLMSNLLSAKTLSPNVVSPRDHADVIIEAICIVLGIPVRIFKGSERGELASSQDESAHDGRCEFRREKKVTPRVISPLVNRLIKIGALPEPDKGGWVCRWPSLREKTPQDRADLVAKYVETLQKYIAGGVTEIIGPKDILTRKEFLGLPEEMVDEVLESAAKAAAEAEEEAAKKEAEATKEMAKMEQDAAPGLPAPEPPVPPGKQAPQTPPKAPKQPPNKDAASASKKADQKPDGPSSGDQGSASKKPTSNSTLWQVTRNAGANCGIGSGGFQPGNTCAKGGGKSGYTSMKTAKVGDTVEKKSGALGKGTVGKILSFTGDQALVEVTKGNNFYNVGEKTSVGKDNTMWKVKSGGTKSSGGGFDASKDGKTLPKSNAKANKMKEVSSLGGSTGAKLVQDENGNKFVKKYGANEGHIKNEYLADKAYRDAGVAVPASKLYKDKDGKVYKLSEFKEGETLGSMSGSKKESAIKKIQEDFALDATMGNWDVVGAGQDNILVDKNGTPWRIDNGGALKYRAQGKEKGSAWDDLNDEVSTMRSGVSNPGATAVFGKMSDADVKASFEKHADYLAVDKPGMAGKGGGIDSGTATMLKKRANNGYAKVKDAIKPTSDAGNVSMNQAALKSGASKMEMKLTSKQMQKLEFLNPNGVQDGTVYVPLLVSKKSDPKNQQLIDSISKVVPGGTKIKMVNVTGKQMQEGTLPPSVGKGKGGKTSGTSKSKKPSQAKPANADKHPLSKTEKFGKIGADGIEVGSTIKLSNSGHPPLTESELNALGKQLVAKANNKELEALSSWKGSAAGFRQRQAKGLGHMKESDIHLRSMINKAPEYDGVTFRGIHGQFAKDHIADIKKAGVNGLWTEPVPACSSRNAKTAINFANNDLLLKVRTKTGAYVGRTNGFHDEDEVILKPGKIYRMTRMVENAKVGTGSSKKTVSLYVEMEEVA